MNDLFDRVRTSRGGPFAAAVVLGLVVGCSHGPEATTVPIEEAPYRVGDDGLLIVRPDLAARLESAAVDRSPIVGEVHGVGEVDFQPGALSALRIPFDGVVESVDVVVGAKVTRDTVLARVRSSELARMRANVRRLNAELVGQYDALRRVNELLKGDIVSTRRAVEIQARVGSLEAERNGILFSLRAARATEEGEDLLEVYSPRDGEVIERRINPGELAHDPDNQPPFIIADPEYLIVTASFPERDAPLLSEGFDCRVSIPALGDVPLRGTVTSVVHAVDRYRRTINLTCSLDEKHPGARAHMLVHVAVSVEGPPQLVVPRDAVLLRRDARVVLVRHDGGAVERRPVVVGSSIGSKIVVVSGVREGEQVVTSGAVLLDGELDRLL